MKLSEFGFDIGLKSDINWSLEYQNALDKVLKIRNERKKIYGDSWAENGQLAIYGQLLDDFGRVKYMFEHGNNKYEKIDDKLIDVVNRCLFLLALRGAKRWQ